jgi:hypothetical protein
MSFWEVENALKLVYLGLSIALMELKNARHQALHALFDRCTYRDTEFGIDWSRDSF